MADKVPVKGGYDGSSLTGLAEFVSGDTLGIAHGGTGLATIGTNQLVTGNGTSAMTSESDLTFDGTTLATTAFTATGNVSLDGGTFIFNESGADKDFRIEGDTEANLFISDASTDRIGIGTATPSHLLDVEGVAHVATCIITPKICISSEYALPAADGSAGQILCTDGSGTIAFAAAASSGHTIAEEGSVLASRTCLNFVGSAVTATDNSGTNATDVTVCATSALLGVRMAGGTACCITLSSASIGGELVSDTSPQLGGNLDVNGNSIISASNGNIPITPNGSGIAIIDGICHPTADGSAGQVLCTNGSAALQWATIASTSPGGSNTQVQFNSSSSFGGSANLTFDGSALMVTGTADVSSDFTAGTVNADGDTSAGDNAAMGYTAAEGLILTGQGSTNDVTIKNDADLPVIVNPTGLETIRLGRLTSNTETGEHVALVLKNKQSTVTTDASVSLRFETVEADAIGQGSKILVGREANYGTVANLDDYMAFWTMKDNSETEKMRITAGGLIGIGTTTFPTDQSGYSTIQMGPQSALIWQPTSTAAANSETIIGNNVQLSGGGWKHAFEDEASYIYQNSGAMRFYTAASAAAGASFNGALRMLIDTCGNVGLSTSDLDNTSTPNGISDPARIFKISSGNDNACDNAIQLVGYSDAVGNSHGLDIWADVSTGLVYFDQRGNHNNYDFRFRTKTSSTPIDVVTIGGDGAVGIGTTSPGSDTKLTVYTTTADDKPLKINKQNASASQTHLWITGNRSPGAWGSLATWDTGGDTQFLFNADGNGYADGSWSGSGADYQEFFESADGSALEVGKSVVMDGDKVRVYNASSDSTDNIIGVVRPKAENKNSAVVGNTAWNHWTDKYLTDDWGVYLREDVAVWEWDEVRYTDGDDIPEDKQIGDVKIEAGSCYERDQLAKDAEWTPPSHAKSSIQNVRKLNPDYDESQVDDYKPREDRDEWNLIGLLGQVQIKANEATNPRWVKMKNISDAVELWLVRQ